MARLIALVMLTLLVLLGTTLTAYAETATSEWFEVKIPTEGKPGGWGLAPTSDIGQLSLATDGTLYAAKVAEGNCRLMRSDDGGQSWSETDYEGELIVDIVCPGTDADTIYLTDGSHVYKSDDGGETFNKVGDGTLPDFDDNETIACLDVGYSGNNHPIVFMGTADGDSAQWGGIYFLNEGDFGAGWTDMMAEGYDVYSLACRPHFAQNLRLVALVSDEAHSYLINNNGVSGSWSQRIELLKDDTTSFAIANAARIGFSGDSDTSELFVGVSAAGSGGVYRVDKDKAYDLGLDADIISLALGSQGHWLLAGENNGRIWYSSDGGGSWQASQKAPTGDGAVYVAQAADFDDSGLAYAATSGTESAFSLSRDGCLTWNQTSLIDTKISAIIDLAPSPQYSQDNTLFMLSYQDGGGHSLWRSLDGGLGWERVYCSAPPYVDKLERVELSPNYGSDNAVVVAGEGMSRPSVWISTDNGQSFTRRSTPLPIDSWAVADDSTWFIGSFYGNNGLVYLTTNGGLSYSEGAVAGDRRLNSIALSPNYGEDKTLLVGNEYGWVYWSEDNGKSFDPLGEQLPQLMTEETALNEITVAFDAEYSSNNTVYAASHCTKDSNHSSAIYRFVIDDSDDWEAIDSLDEGELGTIAVAAEGTLYSANADADGGIERCLNPTYSAPSFDSATKGLADGAKLVGLWLHENQLWSIDLANNKVMSYSDSLKAPVTLISPPDGAPGLGLVTSSTARNISLDWEVPEGASEYQWQLNYENEFSSLPADFEGTTEASSAHLPDLAPATSYYWRVRAVKPVLSPWSEEWSFTTGLGQTVTAPLLHSPEGGTSGVSVEPIFQWSAISGADSYELMVSTFATFDNPTILKTDEYTLPTNAWQCNISLNYDTTYYWKVRAVSADSYSAWSEVSAFSTEPEPSLETSSVAEVPQSTDSQWPEWVGWLMPVGGIALLVFLLVMMLMLIVMIVLVVKVSKL